MKLSKYLLIPVIAIFLFTSCKTSNDNNKLIIGKWTGSQWLVNGNASNLDATNTHFTFDDKGVYEFDYSGNKEAGTYKVENDMLFTTPKNQQEIMVKIAKLTNDSLVFEMNRSGQPEQLTLLKK